MRNPSRGGGENRGGDVRGDGDGDGDGDGGGDDRGDDRSLRLRLRLCRVPRRRDESGAPIVRGASRRRPRARRPRARRPRDARLRGGFHPRGETVVRSRGSESRARGSRRGLTRDGRHERRLAAGSGDGNDVGVRERSNALRRLLQGGSRVTRRAGERVDEPSEIDAFRASSREAKARVLLGHARASAGELRVRQQSKKSPFVHREVFVFRVAIRPRGAQATVPRERALERRVAEVLGRYRRRVARTRADGDGAAPQRARDFLAQRLVLREAHPPVAIEVNVLEERRHEIRGVVAFRGRGRRAEKRRHHLVGGEKTVPVAIRRRERRLARVRRRALQRGRSGRHRAVHRGAVVRAVAAHGVAVADADAVADAVALAVHASFAERSSFAERTSGKLG